MTSEEMIRGLLGFAVEWQFEETIDGTEINFCPCCQATFPLWERDKVHNEGCELEKLLVEARAFIRE